MGPAQTLLRVADELKALEVVNPRKVFDRLENLIETQSIRQLSSILTTVYADITADMGIDWDFTAMQWKLGNNDVSNFFGACPEPRFKVWTLPVNRPDLTAQTRLTTYLPFPLETNDRSPQETRRPIAVR